jgi:hypothetical protein
MLEDHDKLIVCNTLDYCWWLNLNSQIKCQEIFQSFNRIWNNVHVRTEGRDIHADDSVKFRKLMQIILDGENLIEFSKLQSLEDLANFSPPVHNDAVLIQPYNPTIDEELPKELSERATEAHLEFRKYLSRVKENPNSASRREFRNKLCRFLYVIRSNIFHGSKSNYEGSQRNENLCEIVYAILIQICNLVLNDGLYKIAAYGELRRTGKLFTPLVESNGGEFIETGTIKGELIQTENTLMFNPEGEYSNVDVEILQFGDFSALNTIDLVECMPRVFLPYYNTNGALKGFSWVYSSTLNIRNANGSLSAGERRARIEEKTNVFLNALYVTKNKSKRIKQKTDLQSIKIFGGLTVQHGKTLNFIGKEGESSLTSPHASELISFIDEIQKNYVAIFDYPHDVMPYSKMLISGIDIVHSERPDLFHSYIGGKDDPDAHFVFEDIVEMVAQRVADWMCDRIGDEDSVMWDEIKTFFV